MMKKNKVIVSIGLAVTILFNVAILILPSEVEASSKVVAVEGISYNVNSSLEDNLKSLVGKKVYVTIASGETFGGLVKDVGNHLIHLEKLEGKDYYDALIKIETISAINTRFRNIQR